MVGFSKAWEFKCRNTGWSTASGPEINVQNARDKMTTSTKIKMTRNSSQHDIAGSLGISGARSRGRTGTPLLARDFKSLCECC